MKGVVLVAAARGRRGVRGDAEGRDDAADPRDRLGLALVEREPALARRRSVSATGAAAGRGAAAGVGGGAPKPSSAGASSPKPPHAAAAAARRGAVVQREVEVLLLSVSRHVTTTEMSFASYRSTVSKQ